MEYLSSLTDLATRIVRQRISDLPESRGEWDMIRALLTQMVDGAEGKGARELLDVPVMDITECSALLACTLGHRFSVVTTLKRAVPTIEEILTAVGIRERCASIRPTGLGVLELEQDESLTRRRLAEEARLAIDDDGAEVIVLGCGGLGGFDKELEEAVGVPVIDGIVAAVKMAEACHAYGVSTSKVNTYARPNPKVIPRFPALPEALPPRVEA